MTPNDSHYEICSLAMDAGFHVICDKPLTTNLDSAVSLARKVKETGVEFCLTPADRVDRNFPSVDDGVKGRAVVEAAIQSSALQRWQFVRVPAIS
jgi:Oxidoreductase family, NAD-binding Rossmann fold